MADAASASAATTASATPRFDFYQTDTAVTVSIFVKAAVEDSLQVDIAASSLNVKAVSSLTGSESVLRIDPLFAQVDVTSSSYKVFSTKIDVVLHKAQPGLRWASLQAGSASVVSAATPTYAQSTATPAAPRHKSKWDSFNPDVDPDADSSTPAAATQADGGEADINAFFQKLYADADPDTKRAMMKSYQESGGTSLSTDWSKVGKQTVEVTPPDGMEAKKW